MAGSRTSAAANVVPASGWQAGSVTTAPVHGRVTKHSTDPAVASNTSAWNHPPSVKALMPAVQTAPEINTSGFRNVTVPAWAARQLPRRDPVALTPANWVDAE